MGTRVRILQGSGFSPKVYVVSLGLTGSKRSLSSFDLRGGIEWLILRKRNAPTRPAIVHHLRAANTAVLTARMLETPWRLLVTVDIQVVILLELTNRHNRHFARVNRLGRPD
jgi:hypothetical protein